MPETALLISPSDDPASIEAACVRVQGHVMVVGPHASSTSSGITISLRESADVSALAGARYDRVFLHQLPTDAPLPGPILRDIFSRRIQSIQHISDSGRICPHRPFKPTAGQSRALNLFPGGIVPLNKGSNRRSFELTLHLNRRGIAMDLLVGALGSGRRARMEATLTAIAPAAYTFRKLKSPLPWRLRWRREAERVYRVAHGVWRRGPDLFVDRLATRAGRHGARRLGQLVASEGYRHVIVNYGWMTGMIDAVREASPNVVWICDTHDVQFLRASTLDRTGPRLWVDREAEMEAELSALRKYDAVLAISESDGAQFARHLPDKRVLVTRPGFDYARLEIPSNPARPPFRFGFIGWSMAANVMSLELIREEWWPEIRRVSLGSRLTVAGTVCERVRSSRFSKEQGIDLIGFVPTLGSFYRDVDIVLNPVLVQGGLNFKSVETLMAGRLLITNSLGVGCLGEGAPVVVADSVEMLVEQLQSLVGEPAALHRRRQEGQDWALDRFGEDDTYRSLRTLLRGE